MKSAAKICLIIFYALCLISYMTDPGPTMLLGFGMFVGLTLPASFYIWKK